MATPGESFGRARAVAAVMAGCKLALHLAVLRPYGYFRDELYYLACADHLAFGYVDHPPLSIAVLRAWRTAFGDGIGAIRVVPALAGAALVYLVGRLAVAAGGGALASLLACGAVLGAPAYAAIDHYYSMNALDHLAWAAGALLLMRALAEPSPARWAALGAVIGLGLENKLSMLWFAAGVTVTLAASARGRAALRTRGPYVAAAIAILLLAPHVAWQIAHGWPTAEFAHNAMTHKYAELSRGAFLRESTMQVGPATLALSLAGVVGAFVGPSRDGVRPLALVFVVALGIVSASKGTKPEYLLAAYPLVFAAGGVVVERFFASRPRWARRGAAGAFLVVHATLFGLALPLALPVLSEAAFIAYSKRLGMAPKTSEKKELAELPQHYADMHGWDELVDAAAQAWNELPIDERPRARIWAVTGGYGPAAAIDVLGRHRGLPRGRAIATHNNYWLWGYGADDDDGPVVLLGGSERWLGKVFDRVDLVTTIECGYCMPYENHKRVWIGRGMKRSWRDLWPELKEYE
jgi:hypothetical protein